MGSLSLLQGNLPDPGIGQGSPAFQVDSSPAEPPGSPSLGGLRLKEVVPNDHFMSAAALTRGI